MIEFVKSAIKKEDYPLHNLNEVVVIGRSNVGKSSFINSCFGRKIANVGKTPGKTRLLNFFNVDNLFMLVDVPGYGYAKLSNDELLKFGDMMESYFNDNQRLKLAILIVDIRHKPSQDDLDMIEFLKYYNIKTLVIANKFDKLKKSEINQKIKTIKESLMINIEDLLTYSCLNNYNQDKVYDKILNVVNKN